MGKRVDPNGSYRAGTSLRHERERSRAPHVAPSQLAYIEPGGPQEQGGVAVEMTPTRDALPEWRQSILPSCHSRIGSCSVFDEKQIAARAQNATDLVQDLGRMRDGAQRPGHYNGIHRTVLQRDCLGPRLDQRQLFAPRTTLTLRHREQLARRIDAEDLPHSRPVERDVQAGADANFEDTPLCGGDDPPAVFYEVACLIANAIR